MKYRELKISFKVILVIVLIMGYISNALAQHQELFSYEKYIVQNDTLQYRMLLPKDFKASETYPIVLFLHGAGERGNDNEKQLIHGSELFATEKSRDSFPAIVIFPQCPEDDYWSNAQIDRSTQPISLRFNYLEQPTKSLKLLMQLMEEMTKKPFINTDKMYVGGLSMGGMGTYEILYRMPNTFAASIAICGGGDPKSTELYAKNTSMWIFHGADDDVVNPQLSIDMVSGLLKNGGKPYFTLYGDANHNSWDAAFAETELLPWLFSKSKIKE